MINWQPDYKRPLLIISHERSGSNWICSSIKQYKCYYEIFNPRIPCCLDKNKNLVHAQPILNFSSIYDAESTMYIMNQRLKFQQKIKKNIDLHTIKIHVSNREYLNDDIYQALRDYQIVVLKRRNFPNVFWSFLISKIFNSWSSSKDIYRVKDEITVNFCEFLFARDYLMSNENNLSLMLEKLNIESPNLIYYEDLLNQSIPWLEKNNIFKIQNIKNKIKISNIHDIIQWAYQIFDSDMAEKILKAVNVKK